MHGLRDRRFDLILMDIQMPEMDGVSATRSIRALPSPRSEVPIVALTVNSMQEQLVEYLSAGMNGYIVKPFTSESMMSEIGRVMLAPACTPSTEDIDRLQSASAAKDGEGGNWHDLGLFDDGQLSSLRECLGEDSYRDLLSNVCCALAPEVNAVKVALNRGDFEAVKTLAQRLRGDASIVGAQRVARFAKFLGKNIEAEKVSRIVDDMESIYQETLADIRGRSWN